LQKPYRLSPRIAGQVELPTCCPRCLYYFLIMRKLPFVFPMPGIMHIMDKATKEYANAHFAKFGKAPSQFGPFAKTVASVNFPFQMEHPWSDNLTLTARPDFMLEHRNGSISLIDFKTSKQDGMGKVFVPQYEIQVIGYSWVAEKNGIGKFTNPGLIYADADSEEIYADPLAFKTDNGFSLSFSFKAHEVELDYERLKKAIREVEKLLKQKRPPAGADNCKDCILLSRLCDLDNAMRAEDAVLSRYAYDCRLAYQSQWDSRRARGTPKQIEELLAIVDELASPNYNGIWTLWFDE
jgi:PD-(D/E)XK nuclease superfamily